MLFGHYLFEYCPYVVVMAVNVTNNVTFSFKHFLKFKTEAAARI
jgi:hypothetical protein